MRKSLVAALATLVVAAAALSACTATVTKGGTVRVAVSQPFFSSTSKTSFGNAAANTGIVAATNSQFNYYDTHSALQKDESFGTHQVVSRNPFRVRYTVRDGVKWSDGAAGDGADFLPSWAANSGAQNIPRLRQCELHRPGLRPLYETVPRRSGALRRFQRQRPAAGDEDPGHR